MLLAAIVAIVTVDFMLIINDLIETDKVGSFFFVCLAILINTDLDNQKEKLSKGENHSPKSS